MDGGARVGEEAQGHQGVGELFDGGLEVGVEPLIDLAELHGLGRDEAHPYEGHAEQQDEHQRDLQKGGQLELIPQFEDRPEYLQ